MVLHVGPTLDGQPLLHINVTLLCTFIFRQWLK